MSESDIGICYTVEGCSSQISAALKTLFACCDYTIHHAQPVSDQPLVDIIQSVTSKKGAVPTFIEDYEYYFTLIHEGKVPALEVFPEEFEIHYQASIYALLIMIGADISGCVTTYVALRECTPDPCMHCLYRSLIVMEGDLWGHIARGVCTPTVTEPDVEDDVTQIVFQL